MQNRELDQIANRVKTLKFQIKNQELKNHQLRGKLNGVKKLTPNPSYLNDVSPIQKLSQNLRMDRKHILELFKPIKDQEIQYIRQQRIQTEYMLQQARMNEIQLKQQRVRQIEQYESEIPFKRAVFQERKILQAKMKLNEYEQQNQQKTKQRTQELEKLKQEQNELISRYKQSKDEEKELQSKFQSAFIQTPSNLPTLTNNKSKIRSQSHHHQQQYSQKILFPYSSKNDNNQHCQTSFLSDYSMRFDSYHTGGKKTIEKSITNLLE